MKKLIMVLILFSIPAISGSVVDKRKENFQENKENMKSIYNAINSNDFDQIIQSSNKIEIFAKEMPDYFPEDSSSRGASENIWFDFEEFKKLALNNQKAAEDLKNAAQQNEQDELNDLFNKLSNTCKSCHRSFKN